MKQAINLSVFLCLAFLTWWTLTTDDSDQFEQTNDTKYVELFMNDFEMTAMNENGKPNYTLNGTHLERHANSDDTEVQLPVIHLLQEDNQWEVVAEQATINHKADTIQLSNNVVMQQQNNDQNNAPGVTIRTQRLLINTKTQIAQTSAMVDLTQGQSRLRSQGMIFNNTTNQLEFSSNVNGHYFTND